MVLTRSGTDYTVVQALRRRERIPFDPTIPANINSELFHDNLHALTSSADAHGNVWVNLGFCTIPVRRQLCKYGDLKAIHDFCHTVVHQAALALKVVHGLDINDLPCDVSIDRVTHGVPTFMPFMLWELNFESDPDYVGKGPHPERLTAELCFDACVLELRPLARPLRKAR